ncbi:MAG: type III secretion protein [Planctomycetota bacterium]|nr:MAG: type III secretion protein [Planctomycetota bacterium]
MDPIEGIIGLADYVAPASLVFARIGAIFVTAPILGGGQVPFQVKALITLALTIAIMPSLGPEFQQGIPGPFYPLALVKEVVTGLAIGFCFGLFLEAARFAGDLVGRTAGFAAAEFFNPDAGTMEGPLGALFFTTIALLFFVLNMHLALIAIFAQSFVFIPIGGLALGPHFGEVVHQGLQQTYIIALTIALPLEAAVLAITVSEGVIARAVPQINILHITFAVKILTTMALITVAMPAVITFMGVILNMAQQFTFAFIGVAGG